MAIDAVLTIAAPSQTLPVITTDRTRDWVVLNNATWYRLWLKIGTVGGPPATPDPTTRAQWDGEVGAGDTWKVPVPAGWDGTIYVGVFAPTGAAASGLAQYATVSSFATGQDPDVSSSAPVTLLPQQRVVTVPAMAHFEGFLSGQTFNALSTPITVLSYGRTLTAQTTVTAYLYGVALWMRGQRWMRAVLSAGYLDSLASPHELVTLAYLELWPGVASGLSAGIVASQFTIPAGAANTPALFFDVLASYQTLGNPTPACTLTGQLTSDMDFAGQAPPPGIGNGASTPAGAVY